MSRLQYILPPWTAHVAFLQAKNRQLKFHMTPYPNYHFKEQNFFFLL